MSDLTPEQRRVVLALIDADRNARERKGTPEMAIAEAPVNDTRAPSGQVEELLKARRWEFRMVPVGFVKVDQRYHDPSRFKPKRAERMGAEFDEERARTIEVSERADGSLYGLDGIHRCAAAKIAGVKYLPARVFHDLTPDEESVLYRAFNASVALTYRAKWQARVFEGEPTAMAILAIGDEVGVKITDRHPKGHARILRAIQLAESVHRAGLLRPTLTIANVAWPNDLDAFGSIPVRAVASMLYVYGGHPRFSEDHLTQRLSKVRTIELAKKARAFSEVFTQHQGGATGLGGWTSERRAALALYNLRLRTPLPDVGPSELRRLSLGQDIWGD